MAKAPHTVNLRIRLMSQLVLTVLLVWLNVQDTQGSAASLNTRLYKYTTEQTTFQLDIAKENPVSPTLKDYAFLFVSYCPPRGETQVSKLIPDFLFINSFTRNPFYTQATINAP